MKIFDELKGKITRQYQPLKTLSLWSRLKIGLFGTSSEIEVTEVFQNANGTFKQSAVIIEYNGKRYLKRFGRLT